MRFVLIPLYKLCEKSLLYPIVKKLPTGQYSFTLAEPVRQGAFHPLRKLDEAGNLEGDQEVELPTEGAEISFGA